MLPNVTSTASRSDVIYPTCNVGPFVFFDHFGPADFAPGTGIDVRPHPYIGLATISYLFSGEIMHRDSLGYVQLITPGEVNWMTAGRGIVHSERSGTEVLANGQHLHGLQVWVALPESDKETEPAFQHYGRESLPVIRQGEVVMRLIAGSAWGHTSSMRPCFIWMYRCPWVPRSALSTSMHNATCMSLTVQSG